MTKNIVILKALAKVSQKQNRDISLVLNMTTENGLTESRDILVSMKARYYKANSSKQSVPHPFAEGARGWVNPTLESQVKLTTANNANVYIANKANANISVISKETSLRLFSKETALRLFCKRTQDERGNPKSNTIDTKNGLPRESLRILSQ